MRGIWVVVKIMVPFWVPMILPHLIFRVPKKRDHNFDNHPYEHHELSRITSGQGVGLTWKSS